MSDIKDFPMEQAMMSDLVAMEIMGAMVASDLAKNLDAPTQQITAIGFAFAKEFLKQRGEWMKPKKDEEAYLKTPTVIVP
jgi:hypothetical protein